MTEAEYPMKNYGDSGGCISVEAACIMRIGQWALLVSERPLNNIRLTSRHLTSRCNKGAFFPSRNSTLGGRNRSFLDGVSVPLEFLDSLYCVHLTIVMELDLMNHCACWIWKLELRFFSHIPSCGYAKPRFAFLSSTKVKSTKELYTQVYY